MVDYDKLRYRLMPYIYSLAWRVTNEDYTIQRPLVMDWRTDPNTRDIGDEFMFGPAILVSPVLQADAARRTLYLPDSPAWYDFWTGASQKGGHEIDAEAPLDRIPLYVRAGSIIPLGPEIEYTSEKPAGPIELRIYKGADGTFDLYQDAGDSYDYEKGAHAVIPLRWSEAMPEFRFKNGEDYETPHRANHRVDCCLRGSAFPGDSPAKCICAGIR